MRRTPLELINRHAMNLVDDEHAAPERFHPVAIGHDEPDTMT
jgi:hypothetical protein